jgi:hypothetical protein
MAGPLSTPKPSQTMKAPKPPSSMTAPQIRSTSMKLRKSEFDKQ